MANHKHLGRFCIGLQNIKSCSCMISLLTVAVLHKQLQVCRALVSLSIP
jgi:hypothetical protein